MGLLDLLANLGPDSLAEKRKQAMQAKLDAAGSAASGLLAPTTGTFTEGLTRALPITGEAWTANDAGSAIQEGQYGKAAAMGLLGLLPMGGMMAAGLRAGVSVPKRMGQSGAIAYHGSPHKFDKFSLDKIGTGEGSQAYGHGLYLAEHPEVAKGYSKIHSDFAHPNSPASIFNGGVFPEMRLVNGKYVEDEWVLKDLFGKHLDETIYKSQDDAAIAAFKINGVTENLYKTDIPDEAVARFLDWDKPLSQQAPEVQAAISGYGKATVPAGGLDMGGGGKILSNHDGKLKPGSSAPWILKTGDSLFDLSEKDVQRMLSADKGEAAYTRLTALLGGQDAATQHLKNSGIPGIRYLDGGSRNTAQRWVAKHPMGGENTFNTQSELDAFVRRNPEFKAIAPDQTSNFVAFDPEMIRILERNGQATGNKPWKPGEWQGLLGGAK